MSISVTPPLATNSTFYKYEPFSYTFTGGSNFTVGGTLVTYCTVTTSNVVFAASNGFLSTGSPLGETLIIANSVTSRSYTFFILTGRFRVSPAATSIVLYLSEPTSYTFTSSVALTTAYPTPSLPAGLSFNSQDPFNWLLSGTPTLKTASGNYLFIGSNVTTGNVVSVSLSIQVAGERLIISPSTSSGNILRIGTPIAPITFTVATYPLTASTASFVASNLPYGLALTTISSTLPGASATISGTPLNSNITSPNVSSTVTALATGLSVLTSISTVSFTYTPVVVFTAPTITTATFYSNVPASLQVTAQTLFSTSPVGIYAATNLPVGFTINNSGLISGTPTTISNYAAIVTATNTNGLSNTLPLTLGVVQNTLTVTSSVTSASFVVGLTITPIVFTFVSAASTSIASVVLSLPDGLARKSLETSGYTVTVVGTPTTPAGLTALTVTATTTDGATVTGTVPYTTIYDTFTFTSVPSSPFPPFRQNVPITPIQLTAVPLNNSSPIVFFTNTAAIPPGLYVTPSGAIQGTPTTVAPVGTSLNGVTATNGYVSVSPPANTLQYSVLVDKVLATSSNASNNLVPNSAVGPFALTLQSLSGLIPSGNITFSVYSYGITGTATAIGGTLGACVYPDVVLPSYTVLPGTISGLPVVFGLAATNPQIINRYTLRCPSTLGTYTLCRDDGSFAYSNLATGTSRPRDFQWSNPGASTGNTLVIVDGTSQLLSSSDLVTFTRFTPSIDIGPVTDLFFQCTYFSNPFASAWAAVTIDIVELNLRVSTSTDPTLTWYRPHRILGVPSVVNNTYILRLIPGPTSTRIILGGASVFYYDMPNIDLSSEGNGDTLMFTQYSGISLPLVTAIVTSPKLVVGGSVGSGSTILYSSSPSGTTLVTTTGSFTTSTTDIVYGPGGWLAIGLNGTVPGVKFSTDAITWNNVPITSATPFGPIQFDGTSWCVFAGQTVYRHDALASTMLLAASWTSTVASFDGGIPSDVLYTFPTPTFTGTSPAPVLYIGVTPNGPTWISPTVTNYALYQYVQMPSIQFVASDDPVYYLASTPPAGMSWNSSTATLSGISVQLGTFNVDIYAQSSVGISKKTITFVVSQIQVSHKTPTAASYTAYTREKVIADSATATVNDHAVPFEVGPFLLNRPPNKTTAPEFCCDR